MHRISASISVSRKSISSDSPLPSVVLAVGACNAQQDRMSSTLDQYIGQTVADFTADHGDPTSMSKPKIGSQLRLAASSVGPVVELVEPPLLPTDSLPLGATPRPRPGPSRRGHQELVQAKEAGRGQG